MDVISKPFVAVVLLLGLAASASAAAALDMSIISYEARRGVGGLRRSEEDVRGAVRGMDGEAPAVVRRHR
ncbi:hypothetical protein OPV22_007809 [Ensete ventricosum]|uniref:Uncharacterized protein n=1 Tax=Ensete ventricosum TaxID=4639 RepID=A0AAV8R9N3_ENSVE|nr:hypothetical protein OPV22_007809 [Ensete ventricosum]